MSTSTPVIKSSGSSVKVVDMYAGIPLVKATDAEFQKASDVIRESSLRDSIKAHLLAVTLSSGEDYRDTSFIVDDTDYIRCEAAAQAVRCAMAINDKEVSSEFDVRRIPSPYQKAYFTALRFLNGGKDAESAYRENPIICAMGWLVLDPKGFAAIVERGAAKKHKLLPH